MLQWWIDGWFQGAFYRPPCTLSNQMFRGGHQCFQGGQAPSGPPVIRPLLVAPALFGSRFCEVPQRSILGPVLFFRLGTDFVPLLITFFFIFLFILLRWPFSKKSIRLRRFKTDRDEILHECSSSKYTSADGVGFSIWRHTLKMAVILHRKVLPPGEWTKCMPMPGASAIAFRQFLIYSTLVFVNIIIYIHRQ